jgi:hypothetical protein
MNRERRETLLSGNPFSREHRTALVESFSDISQPQFEERPAPSVPVQFLATLTGSTAILTNRVWKYSWTELPPDPNLSAGTRTSTQTVSGSADAYFNFALNGAELNNPAQVLSGGAVTEARATFGIKTGVVADPPSTVTLLPLNQGPNPVVIMTVFPDPVVVTIGGSNYSCYHWMSAANQVDVACG